MVVRVRAGGNAMMARSLERSSLLGLASLYGHQSPVGLIGLFRMTLSQRAEEAHLSRADQARVALQVT
jgi:hypothetical protein